MSRIPRVTPDDLSHETAALLTAAAPGREHPLNLHAEMAHAPAVLRAYMGIRDAITSDGSLEPTTHTAIMLSVAAAQDCAYAQAVTANLARREGWEDSDIAALRAGAGLGQEDLDALLAVVREAARNEGSVNDATWQAALDADWSERQLADAFVSLSLAEFVDRFLRFADTELDLPSAPPLPAPHAA